MFKGTHWARLARGPTPILQKGTPGTFVGQNRYGGVSALESVKGAESVPRKHPEMQRIEINQPDLSPFLIGICREILSDPFEGRAVKGIEEKCGHWTRRQLNLGRVSFHQHHVGAGVALRGTGEILSATG